MGYYRLDPETGDRSGLQPLEVALKRRADYQIAVKDF